ncbi:MAG: sulfur carrier protein ThiS [Verrucomicrobiales bacterium]|nr:sulfur carrier protein ThiS [Verrucomicrobiales bacterium]
MTIHLNGEAKAIEGGPCPVTELLERLGLGGQPVLVELDGQALLRTEFADSVVSDGSQVEVIRMVAGG